MPVDIRSGESIHDLVERTEKKKFGRIDAGFITPGINIRKKNSWIMQTMSFKQL